MNKQLTSIALFVTFHAAYAMDLQTVEQLLRNKQFDQAYSMLSTDRDFIKKNTHALSRLVKTHRTGFQDKLDRHNLTRYNITFEGIKGITACGACAYFQQQPVSADLKDSLGKEIAVDMSVLAILHAGYNVLWYIFSNDYLPYQQFQVIDAIKALNKCEELIKVNS